jgi:hypothetical protein
MYWPEKKDISFLTK